MKIRGMGLFVIVLLTLATGNIFGQSAQVGAAQTSPAQSRTVGVVTAIDVNGNQLTIKSDAGESITVITSSSSALLRLPPGETSAQNAVKIRLSDIAVGE